MSDPTLTDAHCDTLCIVRCWCGIRHAVPESLRFEQLRKRDLGESMAVYCPLGHKYLPSGPSRTKELNAKLARERAIHDQETARLRDQLETQKRRTAGQKAAKTRIKNRVAAGVCPCCNRHFKNLHRHMTGQHPEYTTEA